MYEVVKARLENKKLKGIQMPEKIPQNIAPKPRPEKDIVVARHKSRFGK